MRRLLTLLAVVPWAWCVLVAALDRRHAMSLDDAEPLVDGPLVSVIVPARDEERGIRAGVESLAGQEYPNFEVIVVDDESSDRPADEAAVASTERVSIVAGKPVPPGWVGKSWACHQGFERARGAWLLFTDADVRHAPDTLGRALGLAERTGSAGVTVLPVLETEGLVEQAIQPAAAALIRSFVAPGLLVRSSRVPVAIAAGGFILVSRAAYDGVGGHEAMRHELVDDQMLAIRLKAAGTPLLLAGSSGRVRVRMYVGARETLRGWRKNTSAGLGSSVSVAAVLAAAGAAAALAPAVARAGSASCGHARPRASARNPCGVRRGVPDAAESMAAVPSRGAGSVGDLARQLGRPAARRRRLAGPPLSLWPRRWLKPHVSRRRTPCIVGGDPLHVDG